MKNNNNKTLIYTSKIRMPNYQIYKECKQFLLFNLENI